MKCPRCKKCFKKIISYKISWKKIKPLMGKMSDEDIAKRFNISRGFVSEKRREFKIPVYKGPTSSKEKTLEKNKHLLGKLSDREISKLLGMSNATVCRYRNSLGISSPYPFYGKLGNDIYKYKYDVNKVLPYLGKKPDNHIAKEFNIAVNTIRRYRHKYEIKPYNNGIRSLIEKNKHLLGTISDKELATKLGVTLTVVYRARKRFDIPSYRYKELKKNKQKLQKLLERR